MNVLICNVGSTSLKYQLFRMPEELVAASGGAERVGTDAGRFYAKTQENGALVDEAAVFPTHREAIERMLLQLQQTVLPDLRALDCVGFKVVLARGVSGVQLLTDDVLARMEDFSSIAPAHNPPYLAAIRQFRALLPNTPLIGAFETAFHRTMPPDLLYGEGHKCVRFLREIPIQLADFLFGIVLDGVVQGDLLAGKCELHSWLLLSQVSLSGQGSGRWFPLSLSAL